MPLRHLLAGVVSGTMNMAGNLGSFVTSLAFPYLLLLTGSTVPFFAIGATLNLAAGVMWTRARPEHPIVGERSPAHPAIAGTPAR